MRHSAIVMGLAWSLAFALAVDAQAGTLVPASEGGPGTSVVGKARAVDGTVVSSQAYWQDRRIITESQVAIDDGSVLTVRQIGGSIGQMSMKQIPSAPIPRTGDGVTLLVAPPVGKAGGAVPSILNIIDIRPALSGEKFVRTSNARDVPLYWNYNCIFITYDSAGTTDLDRDLEFQIMDSVFQTWRDTTSSCSYLTFELEGQAPVEPAQDRVNIIKFLEDEWGPVGCSTDPNMPCYNPNAAAITTVSFINSEGQERSGEIVDADIEFNAVHFAISTDGNSNSPEACKSDLANTLTHEVGHLMGLDHTCVASTFSPGFDPDGNPRPWPVDHMGVEVPFCSLDNPQEVRDATMNAFQNCGETQKSTPEPDDVAAICAVYPMESAPADCRIPESTAGKRTCACRVGTAGNDSPFTPLAPLLLIGLSLLWRSRRRA